MNLPALPYKQLAASLALAVPMLLAARAGDDTVPSRGPFVLVGAARAPNHPAPGTARRRGAP